MSKLKKVLKTVSKVVLPQLGVVGGAANGLIQGEGLKGAFKGGLQGGLNALTSIGTQSVLGPAVSNFMPSGDGGVLSSIGKALGGGGGGSSFGGLSNILGGINSYMTQDQNEKDLLKAQRRAEAILNPYQANGLDANNMLKGRLTEGFDPSSISSDPSFKFNLDQGQQALDRASAARGGFYSGQALKDATNFGQNLANTYANDYYNRWQGTNSQLAGLGGTGLNAAGALTDVYDNQGNIKANANTAQSNIINQSLSSLFGNGNALQVDQEGNVTNSSNDPDYQTYLKRKAAGLV